MKKTITLFTLTLSLHAAGQTFIDRKGTRIQIDTSKWTRTGPAIYNKDLVNVGIGTASPFSTLSLGGYLKLGTSDSYADTMATAANRAGMIRHSPAAKSLQYHDGSQWNTIASTNKADTTNDSWKEDATNGNIALAYQADGSTLRTAGTGFVIRDNGNTGIGAGTPESKLTVHGSFAAAYHNITSNTYTAGENDFYVIWSGTAAGTITLPVSANTDRTGRLYYFENSSPVYTLTIDAAGSELIGTHQTISLYPEESVLLIKTNDNTAAGATYDVVSRSRTSANYVLSVLSQAQQTRSQSVPTLADFTAVNYSSDNASDFDLVTDKWTCPKTGVYKIGYMETGYHGSANKGTHNTVEIKKNATTTVETTTYNIINGNTANLHNSVQVTAILSLQQGDQITVETILCFGCGVAQMTSPSRRLNIERL